jgi:hypothetical protein
MFIKLDPEPLLSMMEQLTYALALMFVVEFQILYAQIFHSRIILSQDQTMLELFTTEENAETPQIRISLTMLFTQSREMEQLSTQTHQTRLNQLAQRQPN